MAIFNQESMFASWLRRHFTKVTAASNEWYVISNGVRLALLRSPRTEDMFWVSLEIVPLSTPADPCLYSDDFWLSGAWELIDAKTNQKAPYVIASSAGMDKPNNRVLLRGLYCL